jgi:hypothetical protein
VVEDRDASRIDNTKDEEKELCEGRDGEGESNSGSGGGGGGGDSTEGSCSEEAVSVQTLEFYRDADGAVEDTASVGEEGSRWPHSLMYKFIFGFVLFDPSELLVMNI